MLPGRSHLDFAKRRGALGRKVAEIRNIPAITFEYKVGGKTFHGSRYSAKENLGNFEVNETLAQFPTGADVTVFYNPADPSKVVIERTLPEDEPAPSRPPIDKCV